jgi:hypothetical protein
MQWPNYILHNNVGHFLSQPHNNHAILSAIFYVVGPLFISISNHSKLKTIKSIHY